MTKTIAFSEIFTRNAAGDAIQFLADFNGRQIVCQISHQTLVKEFGARNESIRETTLAFRSHFASICDLAQRKILAAREHKQTEIVV